ncbi:hypothetical protein [Bacteroides sp.]|uniref:hypothetical protein n=2 Tax=Bacteroides TaxID=816 RepID=UPI0004BB3F4F
MEMDELKKSWNAFGERLKDKKIVDEESIAKLIDHAKHNINAMSRFNQRLRILSLLIIGFFIGSLIYDGRYPDVYFQILLLALIPAIGWDLFTAHFLSRTKVDEMPLVTVVSRFNRIHRWVIRERVAGIAFMFLMAGFFFIERRVWQHGTVMIVLFFLLWAACFAVPLWVYRKNLNRLREIRKNLDELKELKQDA